MSINLNQGTDTQTPTTGKLSVASADLAITTAGKGLQVKEGSNAKMGQATLVAGTVTVSTTAVTANSRIFLTRANVTGVVGTYLAVTATTAGTSFVITAGSASETSTINWIIFEPS